MLQLQIEDMNIRYFQRANSPGRFSIERVFNDIQVCLPEDVHFDNVKSKFADARPHHLLWNMMEAIFRQGEVNHITGDIHYVTLLLSKRRTMLTIHDCVGMERSSGFRKMIEHFLWYWLPVKRCRYVTVISESTKKQLLKYVKCDTDKIVVIPNCVSGNFRYHPKKFNTDKPLILQVGTKPNKNLVSVAKALSGICCHLRIIGELDEVQSKTLHECGIEYSSVSGISDTQILEEYENCDMLVFASTYEGFGLPILEAQATGRPVVTSNILSMPEVAGRGSLLVDPFDVYSIRNAVVKIIRNAATRERLIIGGLENVKSYSPISIANRYVRLYREMVNVRQ